MYQYGGLNSNKKIIFFCEGKLQFIRTVSIRLVTTADSPHLFINAGSFHSIAPYIIPSFGEIIQIN
jgi:hypothetical protein